ncbi:UNKNOWN [Stylonychia lemnae]|uniref:Uncharacterized protein n=1 Tax=Stylonychia lemnae TaxID=5949 RepID=A0A078AWW6_STYLE|nr:UNKNOWN [Stylonychia lemnae]|eukprot:CDW85298.1 UNKNOWN [Stylonychia lemnae]
MESSFKQGANSSQLQNNKTISKNPLFSMDTLNDSATSFRIRNTNNKIPNVPRVPTVYGMPKLKNKTLPKLDSQLAHMMTSEQEQKSQDVVQQQLIKPLQGTMKPKKVKKQKVQEQPLKNEEEKLQFNFEKKCEINENSISMNNEFDKSRISTAKSTMSTVSQKSLANVSSETSLFIDPNTIIDENSVLAQLVKTNVQLLQKCLLLKKKQDLAAKERIQDLKDILIQNGGEEAQEILNKINLK